MYSFRKDISQDYEITNSRKLHLDILFQGGQYNPFNNPFNLILI